ncbi:RIO1 family regulatory kinase/ATPase [Phytomonospora sp. NPDC050363]|uniref:serine protein kinase RIO n=1 Tax=Phytomonospora sp. NPDC050363 TaxID=3155642 RepID=UPI0033E446A0
MRERDSFVPMKSRGRKREADDFYYEEAERFNDEFEGEFVEFDPEAPPFGDRWTTWDKSEPLQRAPKPWPDWLITDLGAVDVEHGVLKTGKEADVFLIERVVPDTDRSVLLAAKRYRDADHRMFSRSSEYTEGRTVRKSRDQRAMEKGTKVGQEMLAGQWAATEWNALVRMHNAGASVPYPVQVLGTEVIMEFVGTGREAAPRLEILRPTPAELADLWDQLVFNMTIMARDGFAHGDLSSYNIIVDKGRLVVIDMPQIIDVVANPRGRFFLERDVRNVGAWFVSRGMDPKYVDMLVADQFADARVS